MSQKTPQNLVKRPPVVVIMGHIDHGKSTLLDYIRKSNIVENEAGGITQHLGSYEVMHNKQKITFLDTPGHEAFCSIRERGANVADIAVLVVSAEDGVKTQTIEALKCIKEEKIPFIVAVNKIDKPEADVEKTKQSLAEAEIYVEGYGGDIPVVAISAKNGTGVPELLDMIILVSDLGDFKASEQKPAEGTIIEAGLDSKKGIYATILIKDGSLKIGSAVVAEDAYSPVRIMEDWEGKALKTATFSSPVKVIGWNKIPRVGAGFSTLKNKKEAEESSSAYKRNPARAPETSSTENVISLPFIIKADAIGSMEGIKHEIEKIKEPKVAIKIVSEGVGNINEGDVKIAQGDPNITILSFNSKPDAKAKSILERSSLRIESFDVIYKLVEFIKKEVLEKIPKEYIDEVSGTAKILAVFSKVKDKQILGGKVQQGSLLVGSEVKILRRDAEIGKGKIKELQQQKVKTSEVKEGFEFGTLVESKIEIALGDKLQGFKTVEKTR